MKLRLVAGLVLAGFLALGASACSPIQPHRLDIRGMVTSRTVGNVRETVACFERENQCQLRGLKITVAPEPFWWTGSEFVNGRFTVESRFDPGSIRVSFGVNGECPALYHECGHALMWQEHGDVDSGHRNWRWGWWEARGAAFAAELRNR